MDIGSCGSQSAEEHEPSSQAELVAGQEDPAAEEEDDIQTIWPKSTEKLVQLETEAVSEIESVVEEVTASLPPPLQRQTSSEVLDTEPGSFSPARNSTKSLSSNRWNASNSSVATPSSSQAYAFTTPRMQVFSGPREINLTNYTSDSKQPNLLPAPKPLTRQSLPLLPTSVCRCR